MKKLNRNKIKVFTATTTMKKILEPNSQRKAFSILNNGGYNVEFSDKKDTAYGSGFPLIPDNTIDDDHFNPQGALYVISTTGDVELRVWEILSEAL